MRNPRSVRSFEYKNEYLSVVIREVPEYGPNAYVYCCGINLSRFEPLCWQKAGICSNPAVRGLQLLRIDVSAYARKQGAESGKTDIPCAPILPRGDGWYREKTLLIEKTSPKAIRDILEFSVMDLVRLVLAVAAPDAELPADFPNPPALQAYLDGLSRSRGTL